MIGKVTFEEDVEAILDDGGHWTCPARPPLETSLNSLYSTHASSPDDGAFGFRQLYAAGLALGGEVWIEPKTAAT
jgi:hypothetical protein